MNDWYEGYKMFIESNELKNRIKAVSDAIYEQTDHQVVFEEFIAIPHYGGNIILRYNLLSQHYTLDDLDCYEEAMNQIVGKEFLINFMGSIYKRAGISYADTEEKFLRYREMYQDVIVPQTAYAEKVRADAKYLLRKCSLPEDTEVWEIQVDDPIPLLILGSTNRLIKTVDGIEAREVRKDVCEGLMKATIYAKENHISFGRMLTGCL